MFSKKSYSISELREKVKEKNRKKITDQIVKIKLKIFLTQDDKLQIQKLQQQLDG